MKRFYSLLFCLCAIQVQAQKIRFTDTSNRWNVVDIGNDGPFIYGQPVPEIRFERDTFIKSVTYRRLTRQNLFDGGYAVREDLATGRLYFRFMGSNGYIPAPIDTGERLFFDYNMRLGDTLRVRYNATYGIAHRVTMFDSVRIDGIIHRKWTMTPIPGNVPASEYTFIEGVGSLGGPGWPVFNHVFEHRGQLRCFTNNGMKPVCSPAAALPWSYLKVQWGVLAADSFDNASSCVYKSTLSVAESMKGREFVTVTPNPGGRKAVLRIPGVLGKAALIITDYTGRRIVELAVSSAEDVQIGNLLSAPGVYTYTLQDPGSGTRHTGRFIFR